MGLGIDVCYDYDDDDDVLKLGAYDAEYDDYDDGGGECVLCAYEQGL